METVQQSLFPYLDECLAVPLTESEKRLVNILELLRLEKHVPVSASRQWLGRESDLGAEQRSWTRADC